MQLTEDQLHELARTDPARHVTMVRVISIQGSADAVLYMMQRSVLTVGHSRAIAPPKLGHGSQVEIARYIDDPSV